MRFKFAILCFAFTALGYLCLQAQNAQKSDDQKKIESTYSPLHGFDPARDAVADIQRAVTEARKAGKRILIDVGGAWCLYCQSLDQMFQQHPDLLRLRNENFIMVPVYYGDNEKNEQALSHYSKLLGIPHFFVLDQDGVLLHSQHVAEFQVNGNYSPDKIKEFLKAWSPAGSNLAKAELGKSQ